MDDISSTPRILLYAEHESMQKIGKRSSRRAHAQLAPQCVASDLISASGMHGVYDP